MNMGFTGTRQGLSKYQREQLAQVLTEWAGKWDGTSVFHHGDCVGADAEAHNLALDLGWKVMVHPPDSYRWRAWCKGHWLMPELPLLERNVQIVRRCTLLVGAPYGLESVSKRSGTWWTIRFARHYGRNRKILWREKV